MVENPRRIDFRKGISNTEDYTGSSFQLGRSPPHLVKAENVDLTSEGGIRLRAGRTLLASVSNAHSGVVYNGDFIFFTNGVLTRYGVRTDVLTPLVSGLRECAEVSYVEVAGVLYWTNGEVSGSLQGERVLVWGVEPLADLRVDATGGDEEKALVTYRVGVSKFKDGIESGIISVVSVFCYPGCTLHITVMGADIGDGLRVYRSEANGVDLFYSGDSSTSVIDIGTELLGTAPCDRIGLYPPPPGRLLTYWNGRIIVATEGDLYGNGLYFSRPLEYHHFDIEVDVLLFPKPIVLLEGLETGFYVGLEGGPVYWVFGRQVGELSRREVDNSPLWKNKALRIPANKIAKLETSASTLLPVWFTGSGWVVGSFDGKVIPLVEQAVAFESQNKSVSVLSEVAGVSQIITSSLKASRKPPIAMADNAALTVTRGGQEI